MWEVILQWIFNVIDFFYGLVGDWGLSIIIITVIFRILVAPLMHKQAKSNYKMQKIQPQMQKLQEKYAGDQVRLSQEMQKLYAEAKFNPLAGCLPMLLQMPIFIALFQVLRNIGDYIQGDPGAISFYNLVPSLTQTPAGAFSEGIGTFVPYLILMIIFAGATFFPMIQQQLKNKDNKMRNQTLIMGILMSLFMLWISWGSPAGVLLFWGVSSLIGIAQNQFTLSRCRRADAAEEAAAKLEVKPVEVDVVRKQKKQRQHKKH
ncbi:YidC/Oxa1 family membrane protein insertase [Adlercreutzia sp. ZJ154]|uniref:YidC/Oxa1 family membrane protein insertase n=1 Tax=Adlercreutzia sp. ZJ154 TaxID=2709790 RepID=UPI0013EE3E76|nr:YidC/Oxa1 family membrane protein insertase [Adlercreutzia sp. ZJ154]